MMRLEHLPEPPLEFGDTIGYEISDPSYGLQRLGPFDYTRERSFDSLSIRVIGPSNRKEEFLTLWKGLIRGVERLQYEPPYEDGFADLYRLESVVLPADGYIAVDQFSGGTADQYRSAVKFISESQPADVVYLVEPEHPVQNLHSILKRDSISRDLSTQYLETSTLGQHKQGSVLHNIAVATYAKAGGVAWRVRHPTLSNSCTVGLSFHIVKDRDHKSGHRTLVGVAVVTDEFGRHITMRASQVEVPRSMIRSFRRQFRSLYVPRKLMETVIKGALDSTQWPGRVPPSTLIIHKTTPFHDEEITGLRAALEDLQLNTDYALVHIEEDTIQRAYRTNDQNAVRGLLLTLRDDDAEAVLWTVGKVPFRYRSRGQYVFREKSGTKIGTSNPIVIHLDPNSRCRGFDVKAAAEQVLAQTKMRWNTLEMSIRLPVSIYLARRVGTFVRDAISDGANLAFLDHVDARHFW